MGKEQRNHVRKKIRLAVTYETIDDFLVDYTSNVSLGGIFLVTDQHLQKSHQIHLQLDLPGGETIKADGEVRWISEENDGPKGVGIHFDIVSARDLRKIKRLLDDWEKDQ